MTYSILHISDLHRSRSDPISNAELLSTLMADRDRFLLEEPSIRSPDAIVVSGDLIQGVGLGDVPYEEEIQNQYEAAGEFLGSLTDRLLDGDRSRVVLVPGNHDVDWNMAFSAMTPLDGADIPAGLSPEMFGPESGLRWDWKGRRAYRIVDVHAYQARFAPYGRFLESFYEGQRLTFPVDPLGEYNFFELFEGRVVLVAFNSCHGNDCFAPHGAIQEQALANADLALRDHFRKYDLVGAVWHHHLEGGPYSADYMDVSTVFRMIDRGFRVGFHGHQHRAVAVSRYLNPTGGDSMAVISAGSLCAGGRALPVGVNRQYNIVELSEELDSARVHVREMVLSTIFAPAKRAEFQGKSWIDLSWPPPHLANSRRAREAAWIQEAEQRIAVGDFAAAASELRQIEPTLNSYARQLLLKALREGALWDDLSRIFANPTTAEELVALFRALVEQGAFDEAASTLEEFRSEIGLLQPVVKDLMDWLHARRRMNE